MINEVAIRCFLILAETLNFTETAKNMYMTQQSVSKYIAKLEEDLGFRLFIRTHHYVAMTKAGERFYEFFSKTSKGFEELTEEMRRYYGDVYNSIRFGHLEWLDISSQINDALKLLRAKNPQMRFTGEKHPQFELIELFLQRKLDLIITYREFAPKITGLKKLKILETPLVLLVSRDNPKAVPGATVDDFKGEPFIKAAASHETLSESRTRARRQCRELDFAPSDIIISPNLESAYMATELGQGILISTMLSRMSLHSDLMSYPVGAMEELQCFWHEDQENPAVEIFAKCLEEAYRKNDKEGAGR